MFRIRRSEILAVVLLLLTSCSLTAAREGGSKGGGDPDMVLAQVQNDSYYNVTVYVGDDSRQDRLGDIPSFGSAEFTVPSSMISRATEIRLFADPVGETFLYRSIPVVVSPGELVQWTIKIDRDQTSATIMVLERSGSSSSSR